MNRSLEQPLGSLVPALNDSLPPQLLEYAGSLLAQSRHRASTLKSEEETARLYACAHIACERLKTSLDLPKIVPRPPIPPRIYRRLYTHLDKVLPINIPGLKTPSKPKGTPSRLGTGRGTDTGTGRSSAKGTDPKAERAMWNRTPSKSTGKKGLLAKGTGLPSWVHPAIRWLCASKWGSQALSPTILAGMESLVAPGGRRTIDPWITDNFAPLLAAIALLARTKQCVLSHGGSLEEVEFNLAEKDILDAMMTVRDNVDMSRMDEEEAWEGYETISKQSLESAVSRLMEKKWHIADWYEAMENMNTKPMADRGTNEEMEYATGSGFSNKIMRKNDSMFQDEWDFLSESKQKEFGLWKDQMLRRIDELEKNGAMDIDD